MNLFSSQQQSLQVLQSLRWDTNPKRWNRLRNSAFLFAVFVITACSLFAKDAQARPPAGRASHEVCLGMKCSQNEPTQDQSNASKNLINLVIMNRDNQTGLTEADQRAKNIVSQFINES